MLRQLVRSFHGIRSATIRNSKANRPGNRSRQRFSTVESLETRLALAGWSAQGGELQPSTVDFPQFENGDNIGEAVAIYGDTAIVGAPQDDIDKGSAYIFKRTGNNWTAVQRLAPVDLATNDRFGASVAISGNWMVVGSPRNTGDRGAIYIYKRADAASPFVFETKRIATADGDGTVSLGHSVAIDGNRIIAGAPADSTSVANSGAAYVYKFDTGLNAWSAGQQIFASDRAGADEFGESVAIHGVRMAIGAPRNDSPTNSGSAYVFIDDSVSILEEVKVVAPGALNNDLFGSSIDIDGTTIVVGAPNNDSPSAILNVGGAYVFDRVGVAWTFTTELLADGPLAAEDLFGNSVAIENGIIAVGAPGVDVLPLNADTGAVTIYEHNGTVWAFSQEIITPHLGDTESFFGEAVAIHGGSIIAGGSLHSHGNLVNTDLGTAFVLVDINDEPFFTSGGNVTVDEDSGAYSAAWATGISAGAENESGQVLEFDIVGNTAPALFDLAPTIAPDGTLSFTPAADAFGTATITVQLQDDGGTANGGDDTSDPVTFDILISPLNDGPENGVPGAQSVNEDGVLMFSTGSNAIFVSDIDAGASDIEVTLETTGGTFSLATIAGLAFSNGDGSGDALMTFEGTVAEINAALEGAAFTPPANYSGPASVKITTDDLGNTGDPGAMTDEDTISITVLPVNDAPSFIAGPSQTVNEDSGPQTVLNWATSISAGPADEAGQTVTFVVTGNTNLGLFAIGPAISSTGTLTFTPAANAFGSATITVKLTDDGGVANGGVNESGEVFFTITVNGVNDAPSFTPGGDQTVNEDAGAQSVAGWATAISAGPANEGGQVLTFVVNSNNPGLFAAGPAIASDGTLTYTPAANANGSAIVSVKLTDDGGTANGGVNESGEVTFTINVNAVNDAPSFTPGVNQSVNEDAGAQTVVGWATAISAGPANESGQAVSFVVTGNTNPGMFAAAPAISSNGTLTYTSAANASGSATISVKLTDDGGTANGGVNESSVVSFTITVNPVNDVPTANAQSVSVTEDGQVTMVLSGSDVETPASGLTFTITSLPATGILSFGGVPVDVGDTFTGGPSLVYRPAAGASATSASFNFTVTDDGDDSAPGQGNQTSTPATVSIAITPAVAAGTATLSGGILRIGGNGGGDTMTVERVGSNLRVTINGSTSTFPMASVNEIRIWGRDGTDVIVIDSNVSINATVDAGPGADLVSTGSGHDLIFGGDGIDLLMGNAGNDMIIGGEGVDLITGDNGHDVLVAGSVAPTFTSAMLRDIASAWAANRTAAGADENGSVDESVVDTAFDILSGGNGADWFIVNFGDLILDYQPLGGNGDVITQT